MTYTVGGRTFTALFPDLFVPLTADELAILRAEIEADGVTSAVIVDEEDGVIDGLNRLAIAEQLGLRGVPVVVLEGLTPDEKRDKARAYNFGRRQSTAEQVAAFRSNAEKRRAVEQALQENPEKSDRAIAEEVGVSHMTVNRVREELKPTVTKLQSESATRTGRDGRTINVANIGKREPAPEPDAPGPDWFAEGEDDEAATDPKPEPEPEQSEPEPDPEPEVLRDAVGIPIPPEKRAMWEGVLALAREVRLHLRRAAQKLNELCQADGGELLAGAVGLAMRDGEPHYESGHLKAALAELKLNLPYACVCPHCHSDGRRGGDCRVCRGLGWVTRVNWKSCPHELREAARHDLGAAETATTHEDDE